MADKANITRIDALEDFRASLITYMEKAGISLAETSEEVSRLRVWLLNEQIPHWKTQIRRRTRKLNDAQQELFSAEMSSMTDAKTLQMRQVERCKAALREAEAKLKATKHWIRVYDSEVEPMARNLERLRNMVATDLPKAAAFLAQSVKNLEEYSGTAREMAQEIQKNQPAAGEAPILPQKEEESAEPEESEEA